MQARHVVVIFALVACACSSAGGAEDTTRSSEPLVRGHHRCVARTERVSVASDGSQGNGFSDYTSISGDGRLVAFQSGATNLVAGDTNARDDVFVHDRATGATTRVSVSSSGAQGNGDSDFPSISADGRFVAFGSTSTNLVPGGSTPLGDVFVRDLVTGETTLVSVSSAGVDGNGDSSQPAISADGRFVAFWSQANDLVPNDTNGLEDIFVRDRATGTTTLVSVSSTGEQQNGHVDAPPSISGDGRFVVFFTTATNLAPGATNGAYHVYVHDMVTARTTQVDVTTAGAPFDAAAEAAISLDGRVVAFVGAVGGLSSTVFERDLAFGVTFEVTSPGAYPSPSRHGLRVASVADAALPDQIAVTDVLERETFLASVNAAGVPGNGNSVIFLQLAPDGSAVAFPSYASNLVPGDTNGVEDVFVRTLCER